MKTTAIAFICDDGYVLPTNVAITSIILNMDRTSFYNIYIVASDLSEKSKNIFNMHNSDNVKVHVIEASLGELSSLHKYNKNTYCVATPAALLKFRLPELIKEDKVLYLDGDIIVRCDLSKLYEEDINGFYVGAVVDSGSIYSKNPKVLKHKNYFNSGVMLLNLEKMRQEQCTERLIDRKKESKDSNLMDQNIFNDVFSGQVKFLSIKYNCLFVNLVRAMHKFTIEQLNERYSENFESLQQLADDAKIIHYSSKDKPWKYYDVPLANIWYTYYLRMRNMYMLDFNLENRKSSPLGNNDGNFAEKYRPDIVVSLTTFPARINYVHIPIEEMLTQTVKAEHVILWLSKEQFPNQDKDLPDTLLSLVPQGLEIRWCDGDLKSHKKYFYAMQEFPECIIITIDDDLHYSPYMIEKLLDSYKKFPTAVSAMRTHLMLRDKNDSEKLASYSDWEKEHSALLGIPSMQLFATSGAGTLFPPYCMSSEVFNVESIKKYCPNADDVWLKLAQVMVMTPVVLADTHQRLTYVEGTQETALWKTNVIKGENDNQINKLLSEYNYYSKCQDDSLVSRMFRQANPPQKQDSNSHINNQLMVATRDLQNIKNSVSFKIGRAITFIPRKVRGGIRCLRENGWGYTIQRVKEKIRALIK